MAQVNISLPRGLKNWIESRVAEGRYASVSDYIRDLLRQDQQRADATPSMLADAREPYMPGYDVDEETRWLNQAIDEGLASAPSKRSVTQIMARHRKALG